MCERSERWAALPALPFPYAAAREALPAEVVGASCRENLGGVRIPSQAFEPIRMPGADGMRDTIPEGQLTYSEFKGGKHSGINVGCGNKVVHARGGDDVACLLPFAGASNDRFWLKNAHA